MYSTCIDTSVLSTHDEYGQRIPAKKKEKWVSEIDFRNGKHEKYQIENLFDMLYVKTGITEK